MTAQTSDLFRAKRGVAILAACLVQTIHESDPSFQRHFLERLAAAYRELKDNSEGDSGDGTFGMDKRIPYTNLH